MRKVLSVSAFVLAVSALAYGQANLAGKWMGETQGRGGPQTVTLQLKVDGKTLSGTFTQGEQPATEISDAKIVDASTIMFGRSFTGRGGNAITLNYTGKLSGDELALTMAFPGGGPGGGGPGAGPGGPGGGAGRGPMPITLKRAK